MGQRLERVMLMGAAACVAVALATAKAPAALVAQYTFDESAGPTLNDNVGSAHGTASDVTFVPSTAGAPGSNGFGNAGSFAGSATSNVAFGTAAHPESFDLGTGSFTISGWLKTPTNFENFDRPIFQSTNFSGGGWSFEVGRADRTRRGKVYFTVGGGTATDFGNTQAFSDARLDNDAWHWVAAVNDGGAISLYVDGVKQIDTGAMQPTSSASAPAATEAFFGRFGATLHYGGQLDDWRIYNHALNESELLSVWQANVPEPAAACSFVAGVAALLRRRRRRKANG